MLLFFSPPPHLFIYYYYYYFFFFGGGGIGWVDPACLFCKDLQWLALASLQYGDYHFNDNSLNSFPFAVLLNAIRVGSTDRRTRLGVQGMVWGEHLNFQMVRLPVGPAQSAYSDIAWWNEIRNQQWTVSLHDRDSLITNVRIFNLTKTIKPYGILIWCNLIYYFGPAYVYYKAIHTEDYQLLVGYTQWGISINNRLPSVSTWVHACPYCSVTRKSYFLVTFLAQITWT